MSDRESASSASNRGDDREDRDESTSQPKGWQDQHLGVKQDDCPDNREGRDPNTPRVRWRTSAMSMRDIAGAAPREDPRADQDKAQTQDQPHPPTMPYTHESADIADEPLRPQQDRSQETENIARDERAPKEQPADNEPERKNIPSTINPSSVRDRWRSVSSTWSRKASHLATRLGRSEHEGDDLTSGVYHGDWATGNAVPESDFTDNKHKSEEDRQAHKANSSSEAHRLVRDLTQDHSSSRRQARGRPYGAGPGKDYVGEPDELAINSGLRYRSGGGGVLSQLMKLKGQDMQAQEGKKSRTSSQSSAESKASSASSASASSSSSGSGPAGKRAKPAKWYKKPPNTSTSTLIGVPGSMSGASTPVSSEVMSAAEKRQGKQSNRQVKLEDEIRVTVHIAEIICRQRYIMQLCRALMAFGAPTHRLEEYMQMTAKVLEVDAQFLYLPSCMIMAFDDPSTRTTEFKLVRVAQGVDLARLSDSHLIYKNVIHDVIGIEEAVQELEEVIKSNPRYPKWLVVLVYGLATATVGPFAFNARPIDMPIIFLNGLCVGAMQHLAAPRSVLYSNVFEVTSTVVTSFLARAFGSIPIMINGKREYLFCFSAISQSSIALILPGFLVLCSSLELQSHQIIAGSIRMVYAIIFSLFLGYGITVGITVYGLIDPNAVSDITCPQHGAFKNPYVQRFPFVFVMTIWLLIINQGKWKQLPPMSFIAMCGYITNYFSTLRLGSNSQVANTVGAFCIGILGNLYSRLWHGHAATAILPGIFILVPSGLAATGSLISGVQSANEIRQNVSSHSQPNSGPGAGLSGSSVFSLGFGMIQVAIGITIGLFIAALLVYPYGKRRSGLFSF